MDIVKLRDLVIGQKYYIMSDAEHFEIIDQNHLDSFHIVEYMGTSKSRDRQGMVYVDKHWFEFKDIINDKKILLKHFEIEQMVFKTYDDILVYFVNRVEFLNREYSDQALYFKFDDFIKKQINHSQEIFPEKWI